MATKQEFDTTLPYAGLFAETRDLLQSLGFKLVSPVLEHGDRVNATIQFGRKKVARLYFRLQADNADLRIHPLDPASVGIMAGTGRIATPEAKQREMQSIEAFFRTWLVREGKLDYSDFPTDTALRQWLAKVSALPLPGEPESRLSITSTPAYRIVRSARVLLNSYDRPAAAKLHGYCADLDMAAFGPGAERGFHFIKQSAQTNDHSFSVHSQAWDTGSQGAYLLSNAPRTHPVREVVAEADATIGGPTP